MPSPVAGGVEPSASPGAVGYTLTRSLHTPARYAGIPCVAIAIGVVDTPACVRTMRTFG